MSSAVVIDELPDNFYLHIYSGQTTEINATHLYELLQSVFDHGRAVGGQFPPSRQPQLDLHLPGLATSGPGTFFQIFAGPVRLALEFPETEDAVLYRLQMEG